MDRCVAQGALVIPAHLDAPQAGFVREKDGERHFAPPASTRI